MIGGTIIARGVLEYRSQIPTANFKYSNSLIGMYRVIQKGCHYFSILALN